VANNIVFLISIIDGKIVVEPVNIIVVIKHITKMFAYSAIKIIANKPLLYSILNPETNSDSPSAKSNGVRFVSAKFEINHIINSGNNIIKMYEFM
jgi:hypothetical protein